MKFDECMMDYQDSRDREEIESAVNALNCELELHTDFVAETAFLEQYPFEAYDNIHQDQHQSTLNEFCAEYSQSEQTFDSNDEAEYSSPDGVLFEGSPFWTAAMMPSNHQHQHPPVNFYPDSGLRCSILENETLLPPPPPLGFGQVMSEQWTMPLPTQPEENIVSWVKTDGSSDGSTSTMTGVASSQTQKMRRAGGANGRSKEELDNMDPAKAKRILSNRASAARSKERRKQEIEHLEDHSRFLSQENEQLQAQIRQLDWILRENDEDLARKRVQVAQYQNNIASLALSNKAMELRLPLVQSSQPHVMNATTEDYAFIDDILHTPIEMPPVVSIAPTQDPFAYSPMPLLSEGMSQSLTNHLTVM